MIDIETFIRTIRDSFVGSQEVFTLGSCYHFYLILRQVFPNAEAWYDQNHIITKIEDKFYDINGEVTEEMKSERFNEVPSYNLKTPFNIYRDTK